MSKDEVRLRHMLEAARKAVAFTQGRSRADLETDEQLMLSLVKLIEIVGEAAKHVSQPERDRNPAIPWKEMAGTRDRLIHGYFDVDLDIVWKIVTRDLPSLIAELERLLAARDQRMNP